MNSARWSAGSDRAPSITSARTSFTACTTRVPLVDGRDPVGHQAGPDVAGHAAGRVGERLDAALDLDPLPRLAAPETTARTASRH